MPELPDITIYVEAMEERLVGQIVKQVRLATPFLVRSVEPPLQAAHGRAVQQIRRVGKRIAMRLDNDLWMVLHLMIAGRLHWRKTGVKLGGRQNLAAWDFSNGSLLLTEAGSQRRASLHVVAGEEGFRSLDPGGLEVLGSSLAEFRGALTASNHTLKRALTDPHIFSGIGNAYSDEILHAAIKRLHQACSEVLAGWTARLRAEAKGKFPEGVTAFREGMAVHGRYGLPCPRCHAKVQRIRHAANETNYCPACQTGGRLLADRALSRLLKSDWPRTPEEFEEHVNRRQIQNPSN